MGQFVGGDAFAAMNLAMPLVMINFALADLVGVGSSVPISIALGRKDDESLRLFLFRIKPSKSIRKLSDNSFAPFNHSPKFPCNTKE